MSKPQLAGAAAPRPRLRGQQRHPGAIRTQPRPAAAAQRQDDGVGLRQQLAVGRGEAQRTIAPAQPADAACGTARPPRAAGAARRAAAAPPSYRSGTPAPSCRQRCRRQGRGSSRAPPARRTAPARRHLPRCARRSAERTAPWLGMGDVHAALAGQQELAAYRRHGVVHVDRAPPWPSTSAAIRPAGPPPMTATRLMGVQGWTCGQSWSVVGDRIVSQIAVTKEDVKEA
jgi:hypothetical protein